MNAIYNLCIEFKFHIEKFKPNVETFIFWQLNIKWFLIIECLVQLQKTIEIRI
jgi:hypothetical protein